MKITIESNSGTFDFACEGGERILHAGLVQGLALPYECATGTCGTCRGRIVAGNAHVEWNEAPGFAKLKRDKGDILMCQARPLADCTLRVPAKIVPHPKPETLPAHRTGQISAVRRLVGDVLDFDLMLSRPMTFDAGQFVVLEAPEVVGGRAYSMVNFAPDTGRLRLVVKQMPGGKFSDWLFGSDVNGSEVRVFGPLGRATFDPHGGQERAVRRRRVGPCRHDGDPGARGRCRHLPRPHRPRLLRRAHAGRCLLSGRAGGLCRGRGRQPGGDPGAVARTGRVRAHPQFPAIRLAAGMVNEVAARAMAGRYDNVVAFVAGPPVMVDLVLST